MTLHDDIASARSIGLTRAQLRYLRAVREATADGLPTTHRAIAAMLDVVPAGVYQMLTRLRRDGLVDFRKGESRTIRLTPAGLEAAGREPESVREGPGFTQRVAAVAGTLHVTEADA